MAAWPLTSRIINTTSVWLAQVPTTQRLICCREVEMKPPTQTAATTAEDVRASA
jgi:hypothetical protein